MNDAKFCKRCGTDVSPSARYCRNCGAELEPSPAPPAQEAPSPKPAPAAESTPSTAPAAEEKSVDAKDLVNDGVSLYEQGDYEEALDKFIKATEVDARLVVAWSNKGSALGRLGDCVGAISAFNRALEVDPDNQKAKEGKELCQRMMSPQPQPVEK